MRIEEKSLEVHQAEGEVVWATKENIEFLKQKAAESPKRRSRMLAHPGGDDPMHEMLVVLARDNYIHPHVHPGVTESFYLIEGEMDVVLFKEDGEILEVVHMGDLDSGLPFFYRQTVPIYHTIIPRTDFVAFKEATQGPFRSDNTVLAEWAPADEESLKGWIEELGARVQGVGSAG
jgi:cupin fold WbuC family metalloprotein